MSIREENEKWRAQWPNFCEKCGGWGGFSFVEMHGFTHGAGETMFEPCEALDIDVCHRCGKRGLDPDDGSGPCPHCGWNYDDGLIHGDYSGLSEEEW